MGSLVVNVVDVSSSTSFISSADKSGIVAMIINQILLMLLIIRVAYIG